MGLTFVSRCFKFVQGCFRRFGLSLVPFSVTSVASEFGGLQLFGAFVWHLLSAWGSLDLALRSCG